MGCFEYLQQPLISAQSKIWSGRFDQQLLVHMAAEHKRQMLGQVQEVQIVTPF